MTDITEDLFAESLIAFRHELHRFPELSNQEFETTARIRQQLEQHHIRVLDLPLKTGLVAEVGPVSGPLVVLRSDIDALPIEEQSGVDYRSQNPGVMHACGHDFHSTAALGAAILLKKMKLRCRAVSEFCFRQQKKPARGHLISLIPGHWQKLSLSSDCTMTRRCRPE